MNIRLIVACVVLAYTAPLHAQNGYVIGISVAADTADGLGIGGLIDYSFNDTTSVSLDAGFTRAEAEPVDIKNSQWELAVNHDLGLVGLQASIGQWGDPDEFESDNWSAGLFRTFGSWRIAADYVHRDLELTFRSLQDADIRNKAGVRSNGSKLNISYSVDSGKSLYLSATRYDYTQNLTRLDQFRIARLLSPSSLTLSGSLLNHSVSLGGDWPVGDKLLSFEIAQDRTAVDRMDVKSLAVGWLTPIAERNDLDVSVGVSRDNNDTQYFVSVLFLRYGGFE